VTEPIEREILALAASIAPLDAPAMAAAREHLDRLTKPPGSLGRLEDLLVQLAGIAGVPAPPVVPAAVVIAAGDHGVTAQGVSAYPSSVTAQMVRTFRGGGAAINALAAAASARVVVLDVGVMDGDGAGDPTGPAAVDERDAGAELVRTRILAGTRDMTTGPAMRRAEALAAIDAGRSVLARLRGDGVKLVAIGEMGIGNTTAASAITSAMTGAQPSAVTGRGTGVDDAGRARKIAAVERALATNRPDPADPIGVLAAVGGLEIAALVGVILDAAAAGVPVVLDGFITGAAALVAVALAPAAGPRLIAGTRSPEPGHAVVLDRLGLEPLLDLGLRVGEGSGAALALGVIAAASRVRDGMATFETAGVSGPTG
jgi:nicotinate-nucleotide--dimethylbenzimidazole phosphoribosyltransferase